MRAIDVDILDEAATAIFAGRSRGALPLERLFGAGAEKRALDALALTGQARRFRLPATPASFDALPAIEDAREIVSTESRRLLLRIVSEKGGDPHGVRTLAIAHALAARKLRPNPLDFVRLQPFLSQHAEHLGAAALAWVAPRVEDNPPRAYFETDAIDENNWLGATPSQQATFVSGLRVSDPERGRALVEGAFPLLKADARAKLLAALSTNLSEADRAFFESLAADRAPKVKELATNLLARLPGGDAAEKALAAFVSRVEVSKTGILARRTQLKLEPPANLAAGMFGIWSAVSLGDVRLADLVGRLSLSLEDLAAAAQGDAPLCCALATAAARERRFDLLARTVREIPDAWSVIVQALAGAYEAVAKQLNWMAPADAVAFTPDEAVRLFEALLQPELWTAPADEAAWRQIQSQNVSSLKLALTQLRGPLPAPVVERLLASDYWSKTLANDGQNSATLEAFAAATPKSLRPQMRKALSHGALGVADGALLGLDFLDSLDAP